MEIGQHCAFTTCGRLGKRQLEMHVMNIFLLQIFYHLLAICANKYFGKSHYFLTYWSYVFQYFSIL